MVARARTCAHSIYLHFSILIWMVQRWMDSNDVHITHTHTHTHTHHTHTHALLLNVKNNNSKKTKHKSNKNQITKGSFLRSVYLASLLRFETKL